MQCASRGQQFKISKMRGQDQRALTRIFLFQLVPDIDPMVGDPAREPAIEKSTEPDVPRRGPAEIDIRPAQDSPALGIGALRKSDLQIAYPDSRVTLIKMIREPSARDSKRIQKEIRQDAQRVDNRDHAPVDQPIPEPEFQRGALRDSTRERKIRFLRGASSSPRGRHASAEPTANDSRRLGVIKLCR